MHSRLTSICIASRMFAGCSKEHMENKAKTVKLQLVCATEVTIHTRSSTTAMP